MKILNNKWWFIISSEYGKCYQFYNDKLMWVIDRK